MLIRFLFVVMMLLTSFAQAAHAAHDHPSVHGMFVFGDRGSVHLSHLPMFHPPHQYQAIFSVSLGDAAEAALAAAKAADSSETVYTVVPEVFVLPEMAANPRPFKAVLYKGHFERGGVPIAKVSGVVIKQVLFFKPLVASALASLDYLLIGGGTAQAHLIHVIGGRPDFDQIVSANLEVPFAGVQKVVANEQIPAAGGRLTLAGASGAIGVIGFRQLYLETGDLE